jgi:hypothetical protein
MRNAIAMCLVVLSVSIWNTEARGQTADTASIAPAPEQSIATTLPGQPKTIAEAVGRIIAREQESVAQIKKQTPIVQTYLQEVKLDKDSGTTPQRDHYYLGQARLDKAIRDDSMLSPYDGLPMKGALAGTFSAPAFLQMIYVDPHTEKFNQQFYKFDYVGREFLGEVRCVVFDVTPLPKSGKGRFRGRIWAEDEDYTIVRFNGAYTPIDTRNVTLKFNTHFDSWRANVQPGLWLPFYIYMQEMNVKYLIGGHERFKAETSLWAYKMSPSHKEAEFASMTIESSTALDETTESHDKSPVESKREWNNQAEENVTEGMERAGILTPPGNVDKVLNTVVNNLEITNNLDIDLHCRVATFSTFELFSIGRMIVISRGLLDVIPDEATLASILAQGVADAMTPNPLIEQYGFSDFARVQPLEALRRYSFREKPEDVKTANEKAVQLLLNSPYKDKLESAALFLRQLNTESKALSALISPRLGNSVYLSSEISKSSSTTLDPKKLDQVTALPVGGRIKMNPWDDSIEFLQTKPVPLFSSREKMPFEVTPLLPYLTRYRGGAETESARTSSLVSKSHQAGQPD